MRRLRRTAPLAFVLGLGLSLGSMALSTDPLAAAPANGGASLWNPFARAVPRVSDTEYVTQLYKVILGREPDAGGLAYYTDGLASGKMKRDHVLRALRNSRENIEFIRLASLNLVGREPYPNEMTGFLRGLDTGKIRKNQVIRGFRQNARNEAIVSALYRRLLNREPDPSGIATYVGGLNSGMMRPSDVRMAVLTSDEYRKLHTPPPPPTPEGPPTTIGDLPGTIGGTPVDGSTPPPTTPPPAANPEPPAPPVATPPPGATPGVPADAIDLSQAVVHNSAGDIAQWPATAKLTRLDLARSGVHVEFTKQDGPGSWPDVPYLTPGEDLQYTLWIVLKINGKWHTSGCIEYWRGCKENGGPPDEYAKNWYYAADRWGEMTGHQPAPGEEVGFFVSAGDQRNNGAVKAKERTNVVVVPFPGAGGQNFNY